MKRAAIVNSYETKQPWGIRFFCPGCKEQHIIPVKPSDKGWDFNGDLERPTVSPSILVYPHGYLKDDGSVGQTFRCHTFVRDGQIQFLNDCTHELAGQTVDLPEVPVKEVS